MIDRSGAKFLHAKQVKEPRKNYQYGTWYYSSSWHPHQHTLGLLM